MTVVYLTAEKITLYQVTLGAVPSSTVIGEVAYTPLIFLQTFSQLKHHLDGDVRILLDHSLSHVAQVHIPISISDDRHYLSQQLPSLFSEALNPPDWDFSQISQNNEFKEVLVFALVKPYRQLIDGLSHDLGINIVSVEPESIAAIRHEDPIIGTALKTDLVGIDNQVLNLAPPHSNFNLNWIFVPMFLVLFISANIYLFLVLKNRSNSLSSSVPAPIPTIALPATVPTPTVLPLKIKVLNGTGVPGAAAALADQIRTLGYSNITTGNTTPNFSNSEAIFKDNLSKDTLFTPSQKFIKIADSRVIIDDTQEFNAVFVIGKK